MKKLYIITLICIISLVAACKKDSNSPAPTPVKPAQRVVLIRCISPVDSSQKVCCDISCSGNNCIAADNISTCNDTSVILKLNFYVGDIMHWKIKNAVGYNIIAFTSDTGSVEFHNPKDTVGSYTVN